ncbi:HNH endonuclease [Streptomyces sp. MBT84]|uniref:HNH endonuclease n=1 Tax=Streptomyces sp. MBT84 TaxID=1488414 RepID=UPI001C6ECB37|nr:HNH endonuclease [Streptomyces sp. MBT84]
MDKRLSWFDEGAPKLRQVLDRLGLDDALPAGQDFYACPCCLVAYPREAVSGGLLTIEDVPPRSVGGRPLLLTCKRCNNTAGSDFDSHAATRANAEDFMRGRITGHTLPMTSHVDGIPLRGTAQWTDSGLQFVGVPKRNDPKVQAAHLVALDAYVESGDSRPNHSFTVHTRFDEARARISWIRAAYLAAFAALGWSYIFRGVMDPYRKQLQQPDVSVVPTYIFRDPNASVAVRRVLLVDRPDELRCVAVVMGEHTVFLPSLFRPRPCDELVEAFASRRAAGDRLSVTLDGKEVPWPRWATYFMD